MDEMKFCVNSHRVLLYTVLGLLTWTSICKYSTPVDQISYLTITVSMLNMLG